MVEEVVKNDTILSTTRDAIGYGDDTSFDSEIILHINAALSLLNQLGVGNQVIVDETTNWDEFIEVELLPEDKLEGLIKNYVFLKVKTLFDPPAPSTLTVMMDTITQYEWRLRYGYESRENQIATSGNN